MSFDLVLRNARILNREGTWEIGILDGRIREVGVRVVGSAGRELDVDGYLVSPTFVEPHIHLDKAFLLRSTGANEAGTLSEALRMTRAVKATYTEASLAERMTEALQLYVHLGTTNFRAHIDVDSTGGLMPLAAMLRVREQFRGRAEIQVVAFPHQGTVKDPAALDLLRAALDQGADVVGGFPDVELSPEHGRRHLDQVLALACDYGLPLDVHIDQIDDPGSRFLEYLAARTIETGMTGRVTASHACALSSYPPAYAARVIGLLRQAEISVVACPQTNLIMTGRLDQAAPRRGITAVKRLLEAGVTVACGQDNLQDMFCPFGYGDVLDNARLIALACHLAGASEVPQVFAMTTDLAARVLGLGEYGLAPGHPADLVGLAARDVFDCVRQSPRRLFVLKAGQILS